MFFNRKPIEVDDQVTKEAIHEIRQGNVQKYGYIYERYAPRIYRYLFFKVSSLETAQDLTQETFLKAYEKILYFRYGSFESWLYTIARHTLIDYYRAHKETLVLKENHAKEETSSPWEITFAIHQVKTCLSKLSDSYKDIIILRYVEDLPIKKVSQLTGRTPGNVRVMCLRGLTQLRKLMKR